MTVFAYSATSEFIDSLGSIRAVAADLSEPAAVMPARLKVTNSISCACVVLLSGYFESFLKDIVREHIESVNTLGLLKEKIPGKILNSHYAGAPDALAWAVKQDKKLNTTVKAEDFSRRLGSFGVSDPGILAWESFANTRSNPDVDVVSNLLKGLMVQNTWSEINSLVSKHGRLDTFLTSFIAMRNICAHTGRHSTPPSGSDIEEYVSKFEAIAECLDMLLALSLEEISAIT